MVECQHDSGNSYSNTAIKIINTNGQTIGHAPREIEKLLLRVLDENKVYARVEGKRMNVGKGRGLEIPCTYVKF